MLSQVRCLPRNALVVLLATPVLVSGSYTCSADEVSGEVQGQTGVVCGPKCREGTFDCPTDVPDGTRAQPQCMLQDIDSQPYCGLLCQDDSHCPSGDSCKQIDDPRVGICVRPLSFSDFAKVGTRRKLLVTLALTRAAGTNSRGAQIAKAYAALQNLKRKYGVQDGDPDVLVVKELLSAASAAAGASPGTNSVVAGAPSALASIANLLSGGATAPAAPVTAPPMPGALPGSYNPGSYNPGVQPGYGGFGTAPYTPPVAQNQLPQGNQNAWSRDLGYFANNMRNGVPGLEKEIHDTVWNIEHLNKSGVSEELLRSIIMIGLAYLVIGAAYKYHTMGATGKDMVPHLGFWMEYPKLVVDGVRYLYFLISGVVPSASGGGGGGFSGGSGNGFMPIGGDRDTFAAFEPSKGPL